MRLLYFSFLCSLLWVGQLLAQQAPCGVSLADGAAIKAQMMENRRNINLAQISRQNTTYIPLSLHLVGNEAGQGFASGSKAVEMLCKLNSDFADQNIFFYLNGPVRFIYDDVIYDDAYNNTGQVRMSSYKVPNSLNVFVSANVSRSVAGYYTPSRDFVFIQNSYANGSSTTITHELGHFFTLPHTFYGWEGVDARAQYSGSPAPILINGRLVENVARGIGANCANAADGFCDTEADYISERFSCPVSTSLQDPTGASLQINSDYFMSYSSDNCQNTFSQEQKNAMLADMANRNWTNFPAPSSMDSLDGSQLQGISPINNDLAQETNGQIRLEWDASTAPNANQWVITVERIFNNIPLGQVYTGSVMNQNFAFIPSSALGSNRQFRWTVKPLQPAYTCAPSSPPFYFQTGTISSSHSLADLAQNELQIFPNPVQDASLQLRLTALANSSAQLAIYSLDGRIIWEKQNLALIAGEQDFRLAIPALAAGQYFILIRSDKQVWRQAFIKQ